MPNEAIFFIQLAFALAAVLIACRMGYVFLVGLISAQVVLMNIFVIKQMNLFGLAVTGGNIMYASIFFATDIISEHYGRKKAQQAVWMGFGVSIFFVIMSQLILLYKPNEMDFAQGGLITLFTLTPRIVFASMLAYLISQNLDIRLFEWFGFMTQGKYLWLRNNLSTGTSQLVDTVIFTLIAFYGIIPQLHQIILFTYLIKITVALCDTPFMYLSMHPLFRPPGSRRRKWDNLDRQSDSVPVADDPLQDIV